MRLFRRPAYYGLPRGAFPLKEKCNPRIVVPVFDFLVTWQTAAAFLLAFLAGLMRGYTGFGTPIFLAPIYAVLFGPQATVPLLIIMEIGVMVQMVPAAWPKADLKEIAGLVAGCAVLLPVGAFMLHVLDPFVVKKAIGLMTLLFVAMLAFGWRYRGPRNTAVRVATGAVSGFCNGLTGIGAPPAILYYLSGDTAIAVMRANLVVYFAFITFIAVPSFLYLGLISLETVWRWVLLSIPLLGGVAIGSRLFHGTSEKMYIRAALATLAVAGVIGILG